ncbi:hypothetical protein RMATCC62417_11108 [Rhizopus microsporus]|nr:hypothetical protein RMATCC62417_11108 [Rhizopus microsporus]
MKWKQFLDDSANTRHLMQLSPESHGIIWYGKSLRRRSCLPYEPYLKFNNEVLCVEAKYIHSCFFNTFMAIMEAASREEMAVGVESLRAISIEGQTLIAKKSLISILENFEGEVYNNCNAILLAKSETCYWSYKHKDLCKAPTMQREQGDISAWGNRARSNDSPVKEQGDTGWSLQYNADGVIYVDGFSHLELLLTEVSSGYGSNDTEKVSFDHYKAMFGMLAMIRNIAQQYSKGTFDTFRKLKIHFLHGHGDAIRHWSISVQALGVYLMDEEQKVVVSVDFKQKDITMMPFFFNFFLTLETGLEESLQVIKQLKEEHKTAVNATTTSSLNYSQSLLSLVNSSIIRLNEGKQMTAAAEEGLMSKPSSPDHN